MTAEHERLAGRLLRRGDPLYEQARTGRIFNARRPDRFPAAVLLAESDDDVADGVRLAAERGWTVSVRSGGHSWAAWSLHDDALLIDLGGMRDIAYEPAAGVASVRPAVQGGLELAPVVAATRLPDVPLHDGTARPDGTVVLLHTTVMADSDARALARLGPLQDGPLAGRELGHVRGRTSVLEENAAQTAQNPEGHRYAVDCTWTDAPAAVLAPMLQALWSELDTEHSFSIWYGWAPRNRRPDMAF